MGRLGLTIRCDDSHRERPQNAATMSQEERMPILMVALMALVAFGLIGVLLFTAGSLERHNEKKPPAVPAAKLSR